ncbi:MAG: hypothetical protein LUJ25_02880, partial [Firmicutes bacterium]|nr:hypothetical protein [Bacillota bacterium]
MPYIPVSYNTNPVYPENEANPFATTPTSQPSTLWENVSASFDEGLRMNALSSAYYGGITFTTGQDWGSKRLSADEVTDQLDKRGLAGHLAVKNYGYTQKQLDILCEQKERELQNQDILARNDSSLVSAINFGTRIAAGLLDPTNHIPIGLINNAKYLKTLQSAGGFWSRNAARVAMSAINAGPGNVITESIVGPIQANVLQANYGVEDYFANIGIGSIAGGILGATTGRLGLISELRNSWSGTRQPWQIAMPTDRTIQLRDTWATQQAEAMLRANPTLNETAVRQNAQATAAVFDAYARTLAYDTKAQVEDIYARYAPEFRAGDTTASGGLNQSSIFDVAMESQGEIDPGFRMVEQQDFMHNLFGEDLDTPVTLREIQGYGENYLRDFAELFSDSLRNLDESGMDVEFSPRDILAGHRIGESSAPENIRAASEASVPTAPEAIDYRVGADGNITEGVPQADPNRYQMITEAINEEGPFPRENQIKNDIRAEIGAAKDDKI